LVTERSGRGSSKRAKNPIAEARGCATNSKGLRASIRRARIFRFSLGGILSTRKRQRTVPELVKHARYHWLLLAEGHLTRRRFGEMLGRIALLPIPTG
jgi:hypothetical protein